MAGQAASGMKTTTALAESERESERRPESKRKEREKDGRLFQFFQNHCKKKIEKNNVQIGVALPLQTVSSSDK